MPNEVSLEQMRNGLAVVSGPRTNVVSAVAFLTPLTLGLLVSFLMWNVGGIVAGLIIGLLAAQAPKVAKQWESAVVLRLGRYILGKQVC